jgi:hypothetical protein
MKSFIIGSILLSCIITTNLAAQETCKLDEQSQKFVEFWKEEIRFMTPDKKAQEIDELSSQLKSINNPSKYAALAGIAVLEALPVVSTIPTLINWYPVNEQGENTRRLKEGSLGCIPYVYSLFGAVITPLVNRTYESFFEPSAGMMVGGGNDVKAVFIPHSPTYSNPYMPATQDFYDSKFPSETEIKKMILKLAVLKGFI